MLDRVVARIPKAEELPQTQVQRVVSIEEKIAAIEARIKEGLETTFQNLASAASEKIDIILNFTINDVKLNQSDPWSVDVWINASLNIRDKRNTSSWIRNRHLTTK
mgnify:CR=1 FL=1